MKLALLRYLYPLLLGIFAITIATASSANAANPGVASGSVERSLNSELAGGWHLLRTPNPDGGADAISIMHTADMSTSDLDLAGLMIRCSEGGTEVIIVVLRALPFHARPHVVLGKPGNETRFDATVAAPGTAILLPGNAITLVNGSWLTRSKLSIQIENGPTTIRGVVTLAGLQAAFKVLLASCATQ